MTNKRQKQECLRPKQRDGASTTSAILAAVSLLGVSLGVVDVAAAENVGSVTGVGETTASNIKLAQAPSGRTKQNVLQSNQIKRQTQQNIQAKPQDMQSNRLKRQLLPSNQVKSQDLQRNRSKRQLESARSKCKRYFC